MMTKTRLSAACMHVKYLGLGSEWLHGGVRNDRHATAEEQLIVLPRFTD